MCHPGQTLIAVALIRFSTRCVSMYTVAWVMVLSTAVCKRSRVEEIQNKGWEKVCDFVSKSQFGRSVDVLFYFSKKMPEIFGGEFGFKV